MLAALASFVLHGSAMARAVPVAAASVAAAHHVHDGHAPESAEIHPASHVTGDGAAEDAGAPDHHGPGLCCGSFCAAAIAPIQFLFAVSRTETSAVLPVVSVDGRSVVHEGTERPPRTPDSA